MGLGKITIHSSGWTCINCACLNSTSENPLYVYRLGDMVRCIMCRSEFLVNTMTLEKDPAVELEVRRKQLEKHIRDLISSFTKDTNTVASVSIDHVSGMLDRKSKSIALKIKLTDGEPDE